MKNSNYNIDVILANLASYCRSSGIIIAFFGPPARLSFLSLNNHYVLSLNEPLKVSTSYSALQIWSISSRPCVRYSSTAFFFSQPTAPLSTLVICLPLPRKRDRPARITNNPTADKAVSLTNSSTRGKTFMNKIVSLDGFSFLHPPCAAWLGSSFFHILSSVSHPGWDTRSAFLYLVQQPRAPMQNRKLSFSSTRILFLFT